MRRLASIIALFLVAIAGIACLGTDQQASGPEPEATKAPQTEVSNPPKGETEMAAVKEGRMAPDFTLPASNGEKIALSDYRGKQQVVLYFYPKDDTPGCTREACSFRDNIQKVRDLDAVVLGVSRDSLASHDKFIDKYELPFTLLSDTDGKVCEKYGALVDVDGKKKFQRSTFVIGKDGKIKKIFPKVSVDGHTDEVLAALQ